MDFDDLLVRTVDLLERFDDVRDRWQDGLHAPAVDEYQDTNHAQYRIAQLLSRRHRNLFVGRRRRPVGVRVPWRRHPQHPRFRARLLGRGGRSGSSRTTARRSAILDAANAVIAHNANRLEKRLWSDLGEGEPVHVVEVQDEQAEARLVAARIGGADRRGGRGARDRRLLPHERAVARARGPAGAPRRALPGDRRRPLLRARRDQGRDGLPAGARQPGRRRVAAARRSTSPVAASGRRASSVWTRSRPCTAGRSGTRSPTSRRRVSRPPPSGPCAGSAR